MTRPFDWMPLAETDPLPGDPDAIGVESARLARLGDDMRTQAARLRQIGADTTLVGAYAEELRSAAGDLAQDLDKVSGRYERVASALKDWAPELAAAQTETLKARSKALEAEEMRAAHSDAPAWGQEWQFLQLVPSANPPQLAEASQLFAEAQRMLRDTLVHAQARGSHYANLIDDANDIFKDSGWDNFKDWADRNADWIDGVTKVMGWVATGAAIAAIFIPGVNVLVWTAFGLTALSGVIHGGMLTTGNGSWADLGLDVFALATFGAGALAAQGLRSTQQAARAIAASAAERRAIGEFLETTAANGRALDLRALARAGNAAREQVLHAPIARASPLESFLAGGLGPAGEINDLLILGGRYGAAPGMGATLEQGARFYSAAQMSHLSGLAADARSKVMDVRDVTQWWFTRSRFAE